MPGPQYDRLYVHEAVQAHPRTQRIIERARCGRLEVVPDLEPVYEDLRKKQNVATEGKRLLVLAPWRSGRVEACPCSKAMRCCLYRVLQLVEGCPFDCSYCILQGYLNRPATIIYPELEKTLAELESDLAVQRPYPPRYGAGELGDSLALDSLTGFSGDLVNFFAAHPGAWLELKTKSAEISGLLAAGHAPGNVVVGWSVNAEVVCRSEERRAAALGARLNAAAGVREAGFRLAFHFDPLFHFPGWEEAYRKTVEGIYRIARVGDIAWISLGCFRFAPWMAPVYAERYRRNPLLAGEMFSVPPDRKYRYPQPLRVQMYSTIHSFIRRFDPQVYVYLCLESAAVWWWALGIELDPADELAVERGFPAPPGYGFD